MRQTFLALGLLLCALTVPQEAAPKRREVQGDASSTVTQADCAAALTKLESVVLRVAGVTATLPPLASGAAPAKRTDVIARLDRVFELIKPKIKFTPKKIRYDSKLFALPPTHPQRSALERLVRWGCIAKTGSLATSKAESMKLGDFGDALALFMTRIADITHRPDPKYSPYLGNDGQ